MEPVEYWFAIPAALVLWGLLAWMMIRPRGPKKPKQ